MTFEDNVIKSTVDKLIRGEDYRDEVVIKSIDAAFFDFAVGFFKDLAKAKSSGEAKDMKWYKDYFIASGVFEPAEAAIYAGINKKTITNIYGSGSKETVLNVANGNFDYLTSTVASLEKDISKDLTLAMDIDHKGISINLPLCESLLVINALATKKSQIRGGAWSAIGKRVEKPLLDKLCELVGVPASNIDNKTFRKDRKKSFDREVDYKLKSRKGKVYRIEVKLMGKGNPESADATIARDSDIFIADTLSEQNCNQLASRGVEYLALKDNPNSLEQFREILDRKDIPYTSPH